MNPSDKNKTPARELVKRSLEGDLGAFRQLMDSQKEYAFILARRLLHDEEDAQDVVQEAFIRIWKNLAKYREEVKFTTWLYKIVVNLCYDRIKMESRRNNVFGYLTGLISHKEVAESRDLEAEAEKRDLSEYILSVAKKLPPMENLVFHLRDLQDFSINEIADLAGISVGSVKTNLCYARRRIREAVTRMQESEGS